MIYYAPNKAKCQEHEKTQQTKTMTQLTENAVKAVLTADSTVNTKDLNAAIAVLKGESPLNVIPTDEGDAVINRKQVAVLIGKSLATVDIYGRRGVFRRASGSSRRGLVEGAFWTRSKTERLTARARRRATASNGKRRNNAGPTFAGLLAAVL